jgi:hypothetical protein
VAISYNSNFEETLPFSDVCAQFSLTVNNSQSFTLPGTAITKYQVYFEYASNSNVFVCLNAVPVVPPANSVGTQQYNEYKPKKRYAQGGDVLHFITPDATGSFGLSVRQLPG